MKDHMEKWGWVALLKEIAKTKVFDTAGMNSIQSVRKAKAFDVLLFASEEKLSSEAEKLDYDAMMPKHK